MRKILLLTVAMLASCRVKELSRADLLLPDGRKIEAEVARTPQERARGLMFREHLGLAHGMLFVFDRPQRLSMWMKNMKISLDFLFLGADGRILSVAPRVPPPSDSDIPSVSGDGQFVLELAEGEAERLGLKAGQQLIWNLK